MKIIVTEELLRQLFEVYGKVIDVTLKKSAIDKVLMRIYTIKSIDSLCLI